MVDVGDDGLRFLLERAGILGKRRETLTMFRTLVGLSCEGVSTRVVYSIPGRLEAISGHSYHQRADLVDREAVEKRSCQHKPSSRRKVGPPRGGGAAGDRA